MLKKDKLYHKVYWMLLVTMVLSLFSVLNAFAQSASPSILVLNSYHKGLSWTDQGTEGILGVLKEKYPGSNIMVEYMDWKNYPSNENLEQLYTILKYKYSRKKIDILIATDDAALEFALKHRDDMFSSAPVIFCGVNEAGVKRITQGYSNVTGVIEKVDPEKTVEAILKICPDTKDIYLLFDGSESGQSTGALTMNAIRDSGKEIDIITLNNSGFQEVLKAVAQAKNNSVILITTYYTDGEGNVVGFEDSCRLISENAAVPVFHLYEFGMGQGALGGSMLSGRLQGEYAAKMALRVLDGESISDIQTNECATTRYIFDYEQLKRFNLPIDRVPVDSQIVNKPFSFFEAYQHLVMMISSAFFVMGLFIIVLIHYLKKISKMKQQLYESHQELTQLYEELTASEEELRQQFDELTVIQSDLAASEARYALLFEKMLNGFFVFEPVQNSDGKIIDLRFVSGNPSFEKHTRVKIKDIIGKTWMEVFRYPNRELNIFQKILQTGEAAQIEAHYPQTEIYYLANAFKISDNQVGVVFDNITEYKLAIKQVKTLNEELEQRVTERTNELQSVVNELEAFTYTVSHDLKSPLRAIDGYTRIIFEDYGGTLDADAGEMLQNIRNISRDMMEMINRLLQYSSTSRAILCKEEVNSGEMIQSVFNELISACPEREIKLVVETGLPRVMVDRVLFKQMIYNLLANAIKFTKGRDKSLITVGSTLTESEYMFYIKDNGVGFDMEYSGKLFGIFQRLHTSDEFEGSGIGLVTVKKIIEKHGGRTWIEGEAGIGAAVYFTLPFAWGEAATVS